MAQFLIGFAAGGLVGTCIGVVLMALAAAAGRPQPVPPERYDVSPYLGDKTVTQDQVRRVMNGLPPVPREPNDN